MNKGFTILEVIAAMLVITIGVLGAFIVIQQLMSHIHSSSLRFTAAYLAKEGVEIVRNIRDTNWLKGDVWNNGLGAGDWEADYTTQGLNDNYDGDFLNIDGSGFYSYSSGTSTKFQRKITITPDGSDKLKVFVEVKWQGHNVLVQENLYNWY